MRVPFAAVARTYAVQQRMGGPRIRLGLIWFLLLVAATLAGTGAVAVLFTVVAAVASLQVSAAWRSRRVAVNQAVAGLGAAAVPAGAWASNRSAAIALLAFVFAAVVMGTDHTFGRSSFERDRIRSNLVVASATLRSGLLPGLAAGAAVQVHRTGTMAFVYLASIVCVFDSGDHLIGAGARRRLDGPVAGLLGAAVVVAAMCAINPSPLDVDSSVVVVGALAAVCCPIGQLVGSWMLPTARTRAPALRRLDSWLVTAPVFLAGVWIA